MCLTLELNFCFLWEIVDPSNHLVHLLILTFDLYYVSNINVPGLLIQLIDIPVQRDTFSVTMRRQMT